MWVLSHRAAIGIHSPDDNQSETAVHPLPGLLCAHYIYLQNTECLIFTCYIYINKEHMYIVPGVVIRM